MNILEMYYGQLNGGVLRVCLEQAIQLYKMGHRVMISTAFPVNFFGFSLPKEIPIQSKLSFQPPSGTLWPASTAIHLFASSYLPLKVPTDYKPDWIICHRLDPLPDALRLAKKYSCKVAVIFHSVVYPPSLNRLFFQALRYNLLPTKKEVSLLRRADLLIALPTIDTPKQIQNKYGVEVQVLPYGSKPKRVIQHNRGDFVLCVSRLSLGKSIDKVAKAIYLADPEANVIFAGSTHRTTSEVIRRIKTLGLQNYQILTNVSEDHLISLYSTCRVHVSLGALMPVIEAASCGSPIICDSVSGASEMFQSGIHGYLFDTDSTDELIKGYSQAIHDLLSNERKAWQLGHNAWRTCCETYTWRHHAENMYALLESNNN